jgi:hypothetical protein
VAKFGFTLPVACINGLGKIAECIQRVGLTDTRYFVFDTVRQTVVEMMAESTLSIAPHLRSMPVKLDDVLIYPLTIPHDEVSQLVFSIADGIVRPKVTLQLVDELDVVVHPWRPSCMRASENVWFEPI